MLFRACAPWSGADPPSSGSFALVVVRSLSCVQLSVTPWTTACQASLSITISWSLLKLMSVELVMPYNHLILCCSLLLLPSFFPSIRVFSNETVVSRMWVEWLWGQRGPQSLTLDTCAAQKRDGCSQTLLGTYPSAQKQSPAFICQPNSRTQSSSCWRSEDWEVLEAMFRGWAALSSTDSLHRTPARTQLQQMRIRSGMC